jgi:hypothetical protein
VVNPYLECPGVTLTPEPENKLEGRPAPGKTGVLQGRQLVKPGRNQQSSAHRAAHNHDAGGLKAGAHPEGQRPEAGSDCQVAGDKNLGWHEELPLLIS